MEVGYVFDKTGVIDAKLAVCGWLVHVNDIDHQFEYVANWQLVTGNCFLIYSFPATSPARDVAYN